MSTSTEITRLTTARNDIRTKLVELGLSTSTAKMDALASAIVAVENRGSVSVEVKEGETYTIPKGYHNGSGTVSGVAGGGNYTLQSKTVTPTKSQQSIVPDTGSYGLSDVTVEAIPENYQDVSSVDAVAAEVLANKKFVDAEGNLIAGTMPNVGAVTKTLSTTTTSYTVPKGYHSGTGKVSITTESKSATPTEEEQTITPSSGKVLSKVTVAPIPSTHITTADATATADQILDGKTAYVNGVKVEGTMPINTASTKVLDCGASNRTYTIPAGYHDGEGKVVISVVTKEATPTKLAQTIMPGDGNVIGQVTVNAIPDAYQDVTEVDATAADVLDGKTIVTADGTVTEGTMANNGAVSKTLNTTTTSYTVPAGYHNGSGKVSITLETKTATPTKSVQNITPTSGKVLSKVTVNAIPAAYQDVTGVTADAGSVLAGKSFVTPDGTLTEGTIATRTPVTTTLDEGVKSVTLPAGYYADASTVSIVTQSKDVIPTKATQTITPDDGKVLGSVAVAPIPDAYQDITGVTAVPAAVLDGKYFVASNGKTVEGTMPNNGGISMTMDGLSVTSVTIPAGYTTGGTVSLTSDIEEQLAAI